MFIRRELVDWANCFWSPTAGGSPHPLGSPGSLLPLDAAIGCSRMSLCQIGGSFSVSLPPFSPPPFLLALAPANGWGLSMKGEREREFEREKRSKKKKKPKPNQRTHIHTNTHTLTQHTHTHTQPHPRPPSLPLSLSFPPFFPPSLPPSFARFCQRRSAAGPNSSSSPGICELPLCLRSGSEAEGGSPKFTPLCRCQSRKPFSSAADPPHPRFCFCFCFAQGWGRAC